MRSLFLGFLIFIFFSCGSETLPKPKGYLSLQYPKANYHEFALNKPYSFLVSDQSKTKDLPKNWLKIEYPDLKATIDVTYRPIDNNLNELLLEAEKLVYEHTIKAENINAKDYSNADKQVFGTMHQISGNAASQIQFHATDSTKHFIKASLFFYTKPNYDSILPAVDYLKKDMIVMMESLEWE